MGMCNKTGILCQATYINDILYVVHSIKRKERALVVKIVSLKSIAITYQYSMVTLIYFYKFILTEINLRLTKRTGQEVANMLIK